MEMHFKYFILNKNPFRDLDLSEAQRVQVVESFCDLLGNLPIKIINVAIVKSRIQAATFDVLDFGLKLSIQRIENDLNPAKNPENKFLIITDHGRLGKMQKTARRMQKINFIPSKFPGPSYQKNIQALIEDPLPKDSKQSYFIQLADLMATVTYLYGLTKTKIPFSNRMGKIIQEQNVTDWMNRLIPILNLKANPADFYGVKFHP